jgi:hypothetical protein
MFKSSAVCRAMLPSLLLGGAALAIWILERRRPLRARLEPARRRQLRNAVREEALTIGVEGVGHPCQVTLPRMLAMPFVRAHAAVRDEAPASR